MSIKSRTELKARFENGDIPSATDFSNLMDSFLHHNEEGLVAKSINGMPRLGVGLEIVDPRQTLEVKERGNPSTGQLVGISVTNSGAGANQGWEVGHLNSADGPAGDDDGKFSIKEITQNSGIVERFGILKGGNVGINVSNPDAKLDVNGLIKTNSGVYITGEPNTPSVGTVAFRANDIQAYIFQGGSNKWVSLTAQGSAGGSGTVTSVNNLQPSNGNVTLTKSDIGLGNVQNTSDINKPISNDTQTALDAKANKIETDRTGTTILFDTDSEYGSEGAPVSGDISLVVGGTHRKGVTSLIIHESATAPAFDPEFAQLAGSAGYKEGVVNYIFCNYRSGTKVIYSITQEME